METSKNRAAGYIRVSTKTESGMDSLNAQKDEIARYCKQQDYVVTKYYADVATPGGEDAIGVVSQLCLMLDDADQGAINILVVNSIDRVARNGKALQTVIDQFRERGVRLVTVADLIS